MKKVTGKTYIIIPHNQPIDIPTDVAVCPICGAPLVVTLDGWELDEAANLVGTNPGQADWPGQIAKAADTGFHVECTGEPDIDGDEWEAWHSWHYSTPYVDWLPLEVRLLSWVNARYRFDMSSTWKPADRPTGKPAPTDTAGQIADTPYSPSKPKNQPTDTAFGDFSINTDTPLAPDTVTLARLIYLANSNPEQWWKSLFYTLKDKLLTTYAERDGYAVQHVTKKCWTCEGKGFVEDYRTEDDWDGHDCYRCAGTGIYSERWVLLERWKLGDRAFFKHSRDLGKAEAQEYVNDTAICSYFFDGLLPHRAIPRALRRLAFLTLAFIFWESQYQLVMEWIKEDNQCEAWFGYGREPDSDCVIDPRAVEGAPCPS